MVVRRSRLGTSRNEFGFRELQYEYIDTHGSRRSKDIDVQDLTTQYGMHYIRASTQYTKHYNNDK